MSDSKQVDYIIVGQGLAGSAVAVQLMKRNKKILVIDQPEKNTSSRVAAGLFNPITGRKMTKTWMADLIFPYLHNYYQEIEKRTHQQFFHPMALYRPFLSIEEQNEWMAKSVDPAFSGYIEKISTQRSISHVFDKNGGLLLRQCGYLNTNGYTDVVRQLIKQTNIFVEEYFDEGQVIAGDRYVEYKGYRADKIVFCQGEKAAKSKWFGWVPVHALKGETLKVQTAENLQHIINRGVYIVPVGQNELRIGSTYNFQDMEPQITNKARAELEGKLRELVDFPYEIVGQEWGMRPTTPDRRPIMGAHHACGSLLIFNGMGTKGVSLAPYFSEVFVRWMEEGTDLNKDINVNRYKSLYSKSTK